MIFDSKDFIKNVQSLDDFILETSNGKMGVESLYESIKLTASHWAERDGFHDIDIYMKKLLDNNINTLIDFKRIDLYELFNFSVDWDFCEHKLNLDWLGVSQVWKRLLNDYNFSVNNLTDFNRLQIRNKNNPIYITDTERYLMQTVSIIDKDELKNLKEIA